MYSIEKENRASVTPCFYRYSSADLSARNPRSARRCEKISHSGLTSPEMALGCCGNYLYNYIVYVCNAAY